MTPGLDVGGLEKLLVEFARHADRSCFDLKFLSLTTRGPVAEEIAACGWPVVTFEKSAGLRPGLVLKLARWLMRERVDVVHSHDNGPLLYGAPAARLAGVGRVVHTRHQQNASRLHAANRRRFATRPGWRIVSSASRRIAPSLCRSEGVPAGKVRAIINGVDLQQIRISWPESRRAGRDGGSPEPGEGLGISRACRRARGCRTGRFPV